MEGDIIKNRQVNIFKREISESGLSVDELQLRELINLKHELKTELIEMKNRIHTIKTIVLIWFILGILGLLISVISI